MGKLIDKSALVAEIERKNVICKKVALDLRTQENKDYYQGKAEAYKEVLDILNTLEVKEGNEIAEAFARIIRANLTVIDKDIQYKFEQLYNEITGEKMYQGYND